ncbi:sigma-70 family RNA polymerase sigma factor [Gracilibacillus saliphilus]|uniref:sigma-70 family RNA polymerase sigma factor n=1 Tax=Gracilibacillus saliphilus TaxID=543890 RepID=UPI0013D6B329|nr:sigma-70 family RNA polymerase sigma factor [Gracilibacillus saliphilus]
MEINNRLESVQLKEDLLTKLMEDFGDELKRIAYLYLKDKSQCDDIVQEVFISCYMYLNTFRHESDYKTWLIRITLNKCKDYHRKWSIRNIIHKPVIDSDLYNDNSTNSAEKMAEQKEIKNEIINTISSLKPKYKEILILYYLQDFKLKDISITLKLNFHTTKTRFIRGKAYLKKELEKRGYKDGSF